MRERHNDEPQPRRLPRARGPHDSRRRPLAAAAAALVGGVLLFPAGVAASAEKPVVVVVVLTLALLAAAGVAFAVAMSASRTGDRHRTNADPRGRLARLASVVALLALFGAGAALSAGAADDPLAAPADVPSEATNTATTDTEPSETAPGETTPAETTSTETTPTDTGASEGSSGEQEGTAPDTGNEDPGGGEAGGGSEEESENGVTPGEDDSDGGVDPAGDGSGDGDHDGSDGNDSSSSGGDRPGSPSAGTIGAPESESEVVPRPSPKVQPLDPEAIMPGFASTIWLHRFLPDPTPPAKRLNPSFARALVAASRAAGVRWWLVLGTLRARGADGAFPAPRAELDALARRLAAVGGRESGWRALVALEGRRDARRALALTRYNRTVGLWALVHGLHGAKDRLERRILEDRRIDIYAGGRADIEGGRVDVRVLVLIRYLRIAHRQVSVSSLVTGHRLFASPGRVSAHVYGHAADISMLGGKTIAGRQEAGGLTERAVRRILLLPAEVQPRQVISLLGLGGPSFPLGDHYDHIHVGY